jgi:hypothetical protein|tara:strand:- start:243 stop:1163 length:921 start_codon:yes stop_codon:yes gene_type:complete
MKIFLLRVLLFLILLAGTSELIIRYYKLTSDLPERTIDDKGIQKYKLNQSGYYKKAEKKWQVNKFGWIGTSDLSKDTIITIIGDSFIENIMNPIECNQGSLLKSELPGNSFFEAGRSGVTFIESMEMSKGLNIDFNPTYQLLYLNPTDIPESIEEIEKYADRMQFSIESKKLSSPKIKSPIFKKILYNIKFVYYLYLRYPVLIDKQNLGEIDNISSSNKDSLNLLYDKLLMYCLNNYRTDNLILILHPDIDYQILLIFEKYNFKYLKLNSIEDENWEIGNGDSHWSCYGHKQVSKQVLGFLKGLKK